LVPRTLLQIKLDCIEFVKFANQNLHIDFKLTRVGCGLAGYTDKDIAPFFNGIGNNVIVDELWKEYFPSNRTFNFTE
jgi:metal-sulfur cluster biosynthetic enzyme